MVQKMLLATLLFVSTAAINAQTIYYVDAARPNNSGAGTSWATAEKELQVAINEAVSGDQIWVKAGTYKPTLTTDRTLSITLKNGVAVYGGFIGTETQLFQRNDIYNITTLSGDLLGNDVGFTNNSENSYNVVMASSVGNTTILDGFTINKGNANGASTVYGGGMYCSNASPLLNNLVFTTNSAAYGGGAASLNGGFPLLTNCVFDNNVTDGGGGALNMISITGIKFTNCIFYNNTALYGGVLETYNCSGVNFTNCNFSKNQITGTVAQPGNSNVGYIDNSDVSMKNCIIWQTQYSAIGTFMEILSSNFTAYYAIIETGWAAQAGVIFNPLLANVNDGDGPDNIWRTPDDGLRIACNSPAINAGDPTITNTKDIMGITRVGIPDLGAYESGSQNNAAATIATVNSESTLAQNATGITNYATCTGLIATLSSAAAYTVAGTVAAKVWLETTQPAQYVKRHYEITPAQNATTTTGFVTLYFTQQEFTDFNAVNPTDLPTGPADATGIANLRIEKRPGTSSTGTGLPSTYLGTPLTIDPLDANIVWNSTASRWEVSFDVTGFSGFFVKTLTTILPLRLLGFSGSTGNNLNKLQWETASEANTKQFNAEWMVAGGQWEAVGTVTAFGNGNHSYMLHHNNPPIGTVFYRLKMIDMDGNFSYSQTISLKGTGKNAITVYPNPGSDVISIVVGNHLLKTNMSLYNTLGQLMQTILITSLNQQVNIKKYAKGVYQLRFDDGSNVSFIKK